MPGACRKLALTSAAHFHTFCQNHLPSWLFNLIDVFSLLAVDCVRLCSGRTRAPGVEHCNRPAQPLELYEFEGCPFCRKVRETLSCLDINHVVYPCPRETLKKAGVCEASRYRADLPSKHGITKLEFPVLVDVNTNRTLQGSQEIVDYLWETYGDKARKPFNYRIAHWPPYFIYSSMLCSLFRPRLDMGTLRIPSRKPDTRLELYGFEGSCFVRRVREILSCLELEYLYTVLPRGSVEKRELFRQEHADSFSQKQLRARLGLIQVPFFVDPNNNKKLFESADIVAYLRTTYQTGELPQETFMDYGVDDQKKDR